MADTCVLGHAWTKGRVLCPVCGFGLRAVPASTASHAAPQAQAAPLRRLATPAAVAQPVAVSVGGGTPAPEPVLSPDGQWAWDGTQWQPAHVETPHEAPVAASAALLPASHAAATRGVNTRLLLVLVLVIAAAVAADYFLKLPPLGHTTTATTAPVVVHHTATPASAGKPGRASAAVDRDLTRVAGAEAKAYAAAHAFTADPAVLRRDGATLTSGDRVLVAAKGLGYCAVVGTTGNWYVLNSHFSGSLGTVVYATPAAAESTCSAGLGTFRTL